MRRFLPHPGEPAQELLGADGSILGLESAGALAALEQYGTCRHLRPAGARHDHAELCCLRLGRAALPALLRAVSGLRGRTQGIAAGELEAANGDALGIQTSLAVGHWMFRLCQTVEHLSPNIANHLMIV